MRCDVNISLNQPGEEWGTRTETKNVNSLRSVERAVRSEVERQAGGAARRAGGSTRRPGTSRRTPATLDAGPLQGGGDRLPLLPGARPGPDRARPRVGRGAGAALPEAPSVRRARSRPSSACRELDTEAMVNAGVLDLVARDGRRRGTCRRGAQLVARRLAQAANTQGVDLAELPITPAQVARVVALVGEGALTANLARQVVDGVLAGEGSPDEVVAGRGLAVVSDEGALSAAVDEAIAANPDMADKVRSGKVGAAGALVGAVMKATRGQADAAAVRRIVLARWASTRADRSPPHPAHPTASAPSTPDHRGGFRGAQGGAAGGTRDVDQLAWGGVGGGWGGAQRCGSATPGGGAGPVGAGG